MGLPRINYTFNANNYLASDNTDELLCFASANISGKYGTLTGGIGARETIDFEKMGAGKNCFKTEPALKLKYTTPGLKLNDKLSCNLQTRGRGIGKTFQGRETITLNLKADENNSIYMQGCITTKYSKNKFSTTVGGGLGYTHTFNNGVKLTLPEFWVNSSTIPELSSKDAEIKGSVWMVNGMLTIPINPSK